MSVIESRRNVGAEHFVIQGGTCFNFVKGVNLSEEQTAKLLRAGKIREGQKVGYYAGPKELLNMKKGDPVWIVKSGDGQHASWIAEIVSVSGDETFTSSEMGWDTDGTGGFEMIYTNLMNIRECQIQLIDPLRCGPKTVRNYKTSKSITADLPAEYALIQRYRHAHLGL